MHKDGDLALNKGKQVLPIFILINASFKRNLSEGDSGSSSVKQQTCASRVSLILLRA